VPPNAIASEGYTITDEELLLRLDFPGMALLVGSLVFFFLALEWAGVTKTWTSADVVGTLVSWAILTIVFALVEWKQGE
jgi:uncharacterized protein (DUF486 family)